MKERHVLVLLLLTTVLLGSSTHAGEQPPQAIPRADGNGNPVRSILVLPPLNKTMDVGAGYNCLSTVTKPLAELGYYVFPVAVMDQYLKANGMPTAGEMQQIPLDKVAEIIGADAVLYLEVGSFTYKALTLRGRLVDTHSKVVLWKNSARVEDAAPDPGNSDDEDLPHNAWDFLGQVVRDMISEVIEDALTSSPPDPPRLHELCTQANKQLFSPAAGPSFGPYSPRRKQL